MKRLVCPVLLSLAWLAQTSAGFADEEGYVVRYKRPFPYIGQKPTEVMYSARRTPAGDVIPYDKCIRKKMLKCAEDFYWLPKQALMRISRRQETFTDLSQDQSFTLQVPHRIQMADPRTMRAMPDFTIDAPCGSQPRAAMPECEMPQRQPVQQPRAQPGECNSAELRLELDRTLEEVRRFENMLRQANVPKPEPLNLSPYPE